MRTSPRHALALASLLSCAAVSTRPAPASCAPSPEALAEPPPGANAMRTELFFGRDIRGGGEVGDEALRRFVDEEVCPRFPQGYTLLDAEGAWWSADAHAAIHERTRVLLLLHARTERAEKAIEQIRAGYVRAFRQESVMRVDEVANVSF